MRRGCHELPPVRPNDRGPSRMTAASPRLWVERLTLANYRNYSALTLEAGPEPVVLCGANGSGKTNLLEAVSLLAPGQGLRRSAFLDLANAAGDGSWTVAARVHTALGAVDIGTGIAAGGEERPGRIVRIDGDAKSGSGVLADYVEAVWLTPAMDGLFTGSGTERRRFLDRLILCFDTEHAKRANRFERNRLLADGVRENSRFEGLETVMAESGVALAAARAEAVAALLAVTERRRERDAQSPFPWAQIALDGVLERDLQSHAALDVEDIYAGVLRLNRERDRGAGRTLDGPHRSDLIVGHGPKSMPAKLCSTGEQKALLLGLVLAHAELVAERQDGLAPILLLDEVTAHLDEARRAALFAEILRLGSQAWLTGTDHEAFQALAGKARFWAIDEGQARLQDRV
jgi:DNA replication and repair protein RecF